MSVPQFPTPEDQDFESWRAVLLSVEPEISAESILVGHSIGCAFILRLLETTGLVAGCIMASGFIGEIGNEDFDPKNAPFFTTDFDWSLIRSHMGSTRVFVGDNDPYVPVRAAELLATGLEVPIEFVSEGGHLNSAAGFSTFPQALDAIKSIGAEHE